MVKDIITIRAGPPVYGGLVIGRLEGKVVMIRGAIPGETVEARVDEEKKDFSIATAVRVLDPSPDRVTPESLHFGVCGGCQLQYIAYKRQVGMKEEVLKGCLRRIGGMDAVLSASLVGDPWHYRHRGRFKVSKGKIGFYREKSHEVIDIEYCPLMTDKVNEYFRRARVLIEGVDASEAHISCGDSAFALIKARQGPKAAWDALAGRFLDSGFSGMYIVPDGRRPLRYGKGYMTLDLMGLKYTVSPMSFFQSHWGLNQAVVKLVMEGLTPLEGKRVLDLYAGAGNFSLPAARHAGEVVAVEENPNAVLDGRRNLKLNGIKNCGFVRSGVEEFNVTGPVDVLIADPPRTGLGENITSNILAVKPGRFVYLSCDPATLSRDLKKLLAVYEIESVRMVDFFPQTYHIETLASLRLR